MHEVYQKINHFIVVSNAEQAGFGEAIWNVPLYSCNIYLLNDILLAERKLYLSSVSCHRHYKAEY